MNAYGDALREARERLGLSMIEAGKRLGICRMHVWTLERGKSMNPTVKLMSAVRDLYGLSLDEQAALIGAAREAMKCARCQGGAPGYVCHGCIDKSIKGRCALPARRKA